MEIKNFTITKRDGSKDRFSLDKIMNAIIKAFDSVKEPVDLGNVSKILSTNAKFIKGKKKATFIEVPVVVDTRKLRRDLEKKNILRSLGAGLSR